MSGVAAGCLGHLTREHGTERDAQTHTREQGKRAGYLGSVPFALFTPVRLRVCASSLMIALARKYRPKRFSDLLVQDHVAAALRGAVWGSRGAQGVPLTGPPGVGTDT